MKTKFTVLKKDLVEGYHYLETVLPSDDLFNEELFKISGDGTYLTLTGLYKTLTLEYRCAYEGPKFSSLLSFYLIRKALPLFDEVISFEVGKDSFLMSADNYSLEIPILSELTDPTIHIEGGLECFLPLNKEHIIGLKRAAEFSKECNSYSSHGVSLDLTPTSLTINSIGENIWFYEEFEFLGSMNKKITLPKNASERLIEEFTALEIYPEHFVFTSDKLKLTGKLCELGFDKKKWEISSIESSVGFNRDEFVDVMDRLDIVTYHSAAIIYLSRDGERLYASCKDLIPGYKFYTSLPAFFSNEQFNLRVSLKLLLPVIKSMDEEYVSLNTLKNSNAILVKSNKQERLLLKTDTYNGFGPEDFERGIVNDEDEAPF